MFRSSNASLWLLHCMITELPPLLRRKFILLSSVWFGTKSIINMYLIPFCREVRELCSSGLKWVHPETGKEMISYVSARVCSVDAVARAMLQNIKQFNGKYGCSLCEHPEQSCVKGSGAGNRQQIYPPCSTHRLTTGTRMKTQAVRAVEENKAIKGVKGPSQCCVSFHILTLQLVSPLTTCILFSLVLYECFC